jgi:hypothetical protein
MAPRAHRICAIALLAPGLFAATIDTTGQFYTGKWNSNATRIDGDQSHFFDGASSDSKTLPTSGCNIGYFITGTGVGCNNQPGNVERFTGANYNGPLQGHDGLPWLGNTSTTNNLDISFQPQSPTFTVQLMAEASPNHASNVLGVYATDTLGNIVSTLVIFAGSDTPGKSVTFSPGNGNWGFYFATGSGSYYTERLLGSDVAMQHFAVFKDAGDTTLGLNFTKLWIGAEESQSIAGFPDYNDMIFTVACNECGTATGDDLVYAPEPETLLTFCSGLALLGAASLLGRLRAITAKSGTLRRGSGAQNHVQEPVSDCLYAHGGSSARLAAGVAQTSAAVCDAVCQ